MARLSFDSTEGKSAYVAANNLVRQPQDQSPDAGTSTQAQEQFALGRQVPKWLWIDVETKQTISDETSSSAFIKSQFDLDNAIFVGPFA